MEIVESEIQKTQKSSENNAFSASLSDSPAWIKACGLSTEQSKYLKGISIVLFLTELE
jgi:hypothetical protein